MVYILIGGASRLFGVVGFVCLQVSGQFFFVMIWRCCGLLQVKLSRGGFFVVFAIVVFLVWCGSVFGLLVGGNGSWLRYFCFYGIVGRVTAISSGMTSGSCSGWGTIPSFGRIKENWPG